MGKYTFENVIINPAAEGIEKYIGKEVYFGNTIVGCLCSANRNVRSNLGILSEIHASSNRPFRIDRPHDDEHAYEDYGFLCFIPKKEDLELKYTPFKTRSQFLSAYNLHRGENPESVTGYQLANLGGIWLKSSKNDFYAMVTEVYNNGVVTRPDCGIVTWSELYTIYVFPDGTPCGCAC